MRYLWKKASVQLFLPTVQRRLHLLDGDGFAYVQSEVVVCAVNNLELYRGFFGDVALLVMGTKS